MADQVTITLAIRPEGSKPRLSYHLHAFVDTHPVATNEGKPPVDVEVLRAFSRTYLSLFERHGRPVVTADGLASMGTALFDHWLAPVWDRVDEELKKRPLNSTRRLVIASDESEVLNLPWELLRLPGRDFLGFDARFGIRRVPGYANGLRSGPSALRPRPLRILFLACAPRGVAALSCQVRGTIRLANTRPNRL